MKTDGLIGTLLDLPIFQAEWVLWLLIGLSVASVAVMIERLVFFARRRLDVEAIRVALSRYLEGGDYAGAADYLARFDTMETNTVLRGLRDHHQGPESVEELISSTARKERGRYEKNLNFLATVASNAPFIGLFGTVLGIIRAFKDLAGNMNETSDAVMAGIAEALVATAVGLLVAIPAVIAFNYFKSKINALADDMSVLVGTLMANFKAVPVPIRASADAVKEG